MSRKCTQTIIKRSTNCLQAVYKLFTIGSQKRLVAIYLPFEWKPCSFLHSPDLPPWRMQRTQCHASCRPWIIPRPLSERRCGACRMALSTDSALKATSGRLIFQLRQNAQACPSPREITLTSLLQSRCHQVRARTWKGFLHNLLRPASTCSKLYTGNSDDKLAAISIGVISNEIYKHCVLHSPVTCSF